MLRFVWQSARAPRDGTACATIRRVSPAAALARLRKVCLSFEDASLRPSHGAPTFFVRGKHAFVMFLDNHHGDGRLAIWCAAAPGIQGALVDAEPEHYFVPPYVGPSGWLGVRLDRGVDWKQVAELCEQAYLERTAKLKKAKGKRPSESAHRRSNAGPDAEI